MARLPCQQEFLPNTIGATQHSAESLVSLGPLELNQFLKLCEPWVPFDFFSILFTYM